tara:strand:- start:120 stop:413 length:294 start_codon:yes stop_codon:yes gene_type:complete
MDTTIEKQIFEMRRKFRDLKIPKETIRSEYPVFAEERPQLFDMLCSDTCDDYILNRMLGARRAVDSGNLSQHDASVMVGKDLVDTYVIPTVEKTKQA